MEARYTFGRLFLFIFSETQNRSMKNTVHIVFFTEKTLTYEGKRARKRAIHTALEAQPKSSSPEIQ